MGNLNAKWILDNGTPWRRIFLWPQYLSFSFLWVCDPSNGLTSKFFALYKNASQFELSIISSFTNHQSCQGLIYKLVKLLGMGQKKNSASCAPLQAGHIFNQQKGEDFTKLEILKNIKTDDWWKWKSNQKKFRIKAITARLESARVNKNLYDSDRKVNCQN